MENLTQDGRLLFVSRMVRLFAYGFVSTILVIYLAELGLGHNQIGLLLTMTLIGDAGISLWLTTVADRQGRKKMLLLGALLMVFAGVLFAWTRNIYLLILAATLGVISPSGNEVGPFLAIEQASLSHVTAQQKRTKIFAWYNLAGSLSTAFGALASGAGVQLLQRYGFSLLSSCRLVVVGYAVLGFVLLLIFCLLSSQIEVRFETPSERRWFGLHHSKSMIFKLALLFSLDAFGGGFILQSIIAYWFHVRFGLQPIFLGALFWCANVLAGFSGLIAARLASRIGLIRTMVFTHVPSNVLLLLVPLMPNVFWAMAVLLLRFSISQMDVPTRQSYTMAVVAPDERAAASGITNVARTLGAAVSPLLLAPLMASAATLGICFYAAGGLKLVYDFLLYKSFKRIKPAEES
ncbi:MAG: MFS transporter [Candidatus Omnitrophica bacterium]|nr:MFS transporter [Candidatus Omnitrophota bacterium]